MDSLYVTGVRAAAADELAKTLDDALAHTARLCFVLDAGSESSIHAGAWLVR
jgi:hypothetical protein